MRARERLRREAVPRQRVEHARRRVHRRVRVRGDRVADREEDEDPARAPEDLAEVAPRIGAGRLRDEVVEAGAEDPRVRAEHVEEADHDRRADDRPRDRASRILRLLAERRGRLEADEREDGEHHPLEDAAPVADRVVRVERLQVQVAGVREEHPQREPAEDGDLERAEDHAGRRRETDVAVGQQQDEEGHQGEPDPPLAGVVPADLGLEHVRHRPAELEVEERRHERLEADEEPRDQEARAWAEAAGDIGVQPARARDELGELPDRRRGAEAGDEREADRQRQRLLRVGHGDVDRVRDGRRGRHVRDRLEQDLPQPDRVLPQMVEATRSVGGHRFHREPPSVGSERRGESLRSPVERATQFRTYVPGGPLRGLDEADYVSYSTR